LSRRNNCCHGLMPSNGEVEGPHRSAPRRRGRTISQRPRRQAASASRTPPTIVRRHGSRQRAGLQDHENRYSDHCQHQPNDSRK
jgi:hypothetical protein